LFRYQDFFLIGRRITTTIDGLNSKGSYKDTGTDFVLARPLFLIVWLEWLNHHRLKALDILYKSDFLKLVGFQG